MVSDLAMSHVLFFFFLLQVGSGGHLHGLVPFVQRSVGEIGHLALAVGDLLIF